MNKREALEVWEDEAVELGYDPDFYEKKYVLADILMSQDEASWGHPVEKLTVRQLVSLGAELLWETDLETASQMVSFREIVNRLPIKDKHSVVAIDTISEVLGIY